MTSKRTTTIDFGHLAGTVRDESGNPVADAKVTTRSATTGESFTTITDRSGHFAFALLEPDRYEVKIEAAQYETLVEMDIEVDPGETQTSAYTLHAEPGL